MHRLKRLTRNISERLQCFKTTGSTQLLEYFCLPHWKWQCISLINIKHVERDEKNVSSAYKRLVISSQVVTIIKATCVASVRVNVTTQRSIRLIIWTVDMAFLGKFVTLFDFSALHLLPLSKQNREMEVTTSLSSHESREQIHWMRRFNCAEQDEMKSWQKNSYNIK